MWQKVFKNDAFCGIMHETAAEQKESRSPEVPTDMVILFILMNQQHQLQEVTIACSMKFIKISKITKTDSWHKFLHSLEAR